MNKIRQAILDKKQNVLNVYFTAGHPTLHSIGPILNALAEAGADMAEVGIPYSDPLADGMTIQQSSAAALKNGLTLELLFQQIAENSKLQSIPVILMGYYNQILQYGDIEFFRKAAECGVSGFIIPDLPMDDYRKLYKGLFENLGLSISFLITPMTSNERIMEADELSSGFIYVVSQSSITGKTGELSAVQLAYFERIKSLQLNSPTLIGFGIHDRQSFDSACKYSNGAIVGSAFIRHLNEEGADYEKIKSFIKSIIT